MKYSIKTLLIVCSMALVAVGCEDSYDSLVQDRLDRNPVPDSEINASAGSADFSNYVAIGNSLTAGFMDGALYNLGQQNSIPLLLANQLQAAGGGAFVQADINSEAGFNSSVSPNPGPNGTVFGRFKLDTNIPGPSPVVNGEPITEYSGDTGALNNFGVPGAILAQFLTPATGVQGSPAYNPYYGRFASSPGTSTILSDALATSPTFLTLWVGNNDVLGYALNGATDASNFTPVQEFRAQYNAMISAVINQSSANGVIINIPSILALPYFRAVTFNAVPLDEPTAAQLNAAYTDYNNGVNQAAQGGFISQQEAQRRQIAFSAGNNAFVIEDETLTAIPGLPKLRQSEPTDLARLPLGSLLGVDRGNGPYGLQDPVTDSFMLIPQEQQQIEQRRAAFNQIIADAVNNNSDRLALYNTNAPDGAFADLFGISDGTLGLTINSVNLTPDFHPSGVFSTDGIHPNPRGTAVVANQIIDVIEANFGATLPRVDVLNLPSVQLCAGNCLSQQ